MNFKIFWTILVKAKPFPPQIWVFQRRRLQVVPAEMSWKGTPTVCRRPKKSQTYTQWWLIPPQKEGRNPWIQDFLAIKHGTLGQPLGILTRSRPQGTKGQTQVSGQASDRPHQTRKTSNKNQARREHLLRRVWANGLSLNHCPG